MKVSILTFSQTGNTYKAGFSIAIGLQSAGFEVDQVRFLHRNKWRPDDADIVGIGCPVFENRPAEVVLEYFANSEFDFTGKHAFVFITSGGAPAKSLWHLSLAITKIGASVMGGIQLRGAGSFPPLFGLFQGRPNKKDLKHAENFGHAIAANMTHGEPLPSIYKIDSGQGGIFYDKIGPCLNYIKKKTTPLPICNSEKCDFCGNCVYECPTDSIKIENKVVKFNNTCIVCYRCWHVCPQAAISIKFSPGSGLIERTLFSEKMERLFGDLKQEEVYGQNLYKDALAQKIRLKYNRKNPTAEYVYQKK